MPGCCLNWRRTSSIILWAAFPTADIVKAENKKGKTPPKRTPTRTLIFVISTLATPACSLNEVKRIMAVKAADPIAKPLPIAAVVFPTASRLSVILRTSLGKFAISARPPALSAIGP